jgi:hypothetical protein
MVTGSPVIANITNRIYLTIYITMEAGGVVKKPGIGGFLSKILGAGVKETVDSIGNAIDKIDKSDEKLELQLKYKELLMHIEGACIEYESSRKRKARVGCNEIGGQC